MIDIKLDLGRMDLKNLKEILNDPQSRQLIEKNQWSDFYTDLVSAFPAHLVSDVTSFLLSLDINPLPYLKRIPSNFFN